MAGAAFHHLGAAPVALDGPRDVFRRCNASCVILGTELRPPRSVAYWAICPQREAQMKRVLMAATVLSVFAGTPALAQTVVGPAETVVIEPEQRTVIRD